MPVEIPVDFDMSYLRSFGGFDIWAQGSEGGLETPKVKAIPRTFKFSE